MTSQERQEIRKMIQAAISKDRLDTRKEILKILPEVLGRSLVQIKEYFLRNIP